MKINLYKLIVILSLIPFLVFAGELKIINRELIFTPGLTGDSHASTILDAGNGKLIAAWFGGSKEGNSDVKIWSSSKENDKWSPPKIVASGIVDGSPSPTWNPVLFRDEKNTLLFYKVGENPLKWKGFYKISTNNGISWSEERKLPNGFLGPTKNKPVKIKDRIFIPSSTENNMGWFVHVELTNDFQKFNSTEIKKDERTSVIQPIIMKFSDDNIQIYARSDQGFLMKAGSSDIGNSWSILRKSAIISSNSGMDGIVLKNGIGLIVHNPTHDRSTLSISATKDEGKTWKDVLTLESTPGMEFSYPAIIQANDDSIHVTYTYDRKSIMHVKISGTN